MKSTNIQIDHIARIEGHGNVHVLVEDGQVKDVEITVVEPARLFESMVKGRIYSEIPYIASRICGICSPSHVITDIEAVESAFGIVPTDRTRALRELLVYGSYLQNHATHLYVLAAPDFTGTTSVFPLAQTAPELFADALGLKALGNELCTKVGGRPIHPITAVPGGFTHEISADDYQYFAEKLDDAIPFALQTVNLFASFDVPEIETEGDMLAMVEQGRYPVEGSDLAYLVRSDVCFPAADLHEYIEEYEVSHSGALFSRVKATGSSYFIGSLARVNASWDYLCSQAKLAAAKAGLRPSGYNPYRNNIAQAVELVDALNRCRDLCLRLQTDEFEGSSKPVAFTPQAGRGIGYTEAPRGALFHDLTFDENGRVTHASIMTPTAQNLANLEADVRLLAKACIEQGADAAELRLNVEKLVRAYDPCLSCSVH